MRKEGEDNRVRKAAVKEEEDSPDLKCATDGKKRDLREERVVLADPHTRDDGRFLLLGPLHPQHLGSSHKVWLWGSL